MALLERVATLIRANLNDLIEKAEDPEKLIKQVILDMQNQLLQVKTQVAIATADQHLRSEAISEAHAELHTDSLDDKFAAMEKEGEIERLLADIKARKSLTA